MKRPVSVVLALLSAAGAVLFALAFHDRYWRWRDCFNELGRCYEPASEQVFLEQAGLVWGTFAVACAMLCMLFVWLARRR